MSNSTDSIGKAPFGKTSDGQTVDIYTLRNSKGAEARIMTYGGIVVSLTMPIGPAILRTLCSAMTTLRVI